MTPSRAAPIRSDEEQQRLEDLTLGDMVKGLRRLQQIGWIFLGVMSAGGVGAYFKIPEELKVVREEHHIIRRDQQRIIREATRSNQMMEYVLCVVRERAETGGDVRICRNLYPQQRRANEDEPDSLDVMPIQP